VGQAAKLARTVLTVEHRFHLEPGQKKLEFAKCPAGTAIISGGFHQRGADGIVLTSGPIVTVGQSDYEVYIEDPLGPPDFRLASPEDVTVDALCGQIGTPVVLGYGGTLGKPPTRRQRGTMHRVEGTVHINAGAGNSKNFLVACPNGTEIISGGFHQTQDQGIPLVASPSTRQDGYEAYFYNPPSNPQWPSPSEPRLGRVGKPEDVQLVAFCGEIGRPLVLGANPIESKSRDRVKRPAHAKHGNIVRHDHNEPVPIGQQNVVNASCPINRFFALSGGMAQNSDHGVFRGSQADVGFWAVDVRNPQPNPLWAEPPAAAQASAIALCAPQNTPLIPGPIPLR
jgi:hypothetical protein